MLQHHVHDAQLSRTSLVTKLVEKTIWKQMDDIGEIHIALYYIKTFSFMNNYAWIQNVSVQLV